MMRRFGSATSAPERIGDEIDRMAELGQRLDAMVFAEWRAARLEERLRRQHQDAQRAHRRTSDPLVGVYLQGLVALW